jgi:hypothetical protein
VIKLAVMQPYFLPYIGYFQLMAAADKFILFDDVNFINRGWINRNRILVGGKDYLFTVPLKGVSQNHRINEIYLANDIAWRSKLLRTIEQTYKSSRHFDEVFPVISSVINCPEIKLANFIANSLIEIKSFIGIECEIVLTSAIYGNAELKGEERIIDICRQERATEYINLPGGEHLYDREKFRAVGVDLHFIKPNLSEYKQKSELFVPWLSIIDVLMCNDKKKIVEMLGQWN